MSDNLPAVVNETPREITKADTDSWIDVVGEVAKFAGYIAGTEFVPKSLRDSPAAATAAIMYGREVGLPPMTSLTQTHVIEGRPSMSAEAMRALVLSAGHEIEVLESTGAICRMRAKRRGSERWSTEVMWTIDMARAAGLLNKNNWKNYPRQMLTARCSAELCTRDFPDVVLGFKAVEEMEDAGGEESTTTAFQEPGTKVQRNRRAVKKTPTPAALPAAPKPTSRPEAAGPPLPGEAGFDDPTAPGAGAEQASGTSDDDHAGSQPVEVGMDTEDVPDAAPATVEGPTDAEVEDPPAEPDDELAAKRDAAAGPRKASRAQQRMMHASFGNLGIDDDQPGGREERMHITGVIVGRPVESSDDLTTVEMSRLIDTLARVRDRPGLNELLDAIERGEDQ